MRVRGTSVGSPKLKPSEDNWGNDWDDDWGDAKGGSSGGGGGDSRSKTHAMTLTESAEAGRSVFIGSQVSVRRQ